jgi:hypothetical protein
MTADEVRNIEEAIAAVVRRIRETEIRPLVERVAALERALEVERRISALEARVGGGESIASKVMKGGSVSDREWHEFCSRMWPQRSLNGSSH